MKSVEIVPRHSSTLQAKSTLELGNAVLSLADHSRLTHSLSFEGTTKAKNKFELCLLIIMIYAPEAGLKIRIHLLG